MGGSGLLGDESLSFAEQQFLGLEKKLRGSKEFPLYAE